MEAKERAVLYYRSIGGAAPFGDWRKRIADDGAKAAIDARIARFRGGNFGNSKSVGRGVIESKIDLGPGYRIYFGLDGQGIILLLYGGDKSSQDSDIALAQKYWDDYKKRKKVQESND